MPCRPRQPSDAEHSNRHTGANALGYARSHERRTADTRYEAHADRGPSPGGLARARRLQDAAADGRAAAPLHQAVGAVHLGQRPHRPRAQLLDRRRLRALPPRPRRRGAVRVRLRRLRLARRARRDRRRRAAERLGAPLRRAHDRTARAARLLLRLGALVPQLRRDHVPLVAVAVPGAARGRADLPRHRQRRLVRALPDDARLDPGRGRRHLLALSRSRAADRAAAVVPADQRLRGRERPPPGGAAASGIWDEVALPPRRSCSGASTASSWSWQGPTARS